MFWPAFSISKGYINTVTIAAYTWSASSSNQLCSSNVPANDDHEREKNHQEGHPKEEWGRGEASQPQGPKVDSPPLEKLGCYSTVLCPNPATAQEGDPVFPILEYVS